MQRHHPDKSPDPAAAADRAAQISRAYDVLSQPAQRAAYDAQLATEQRGQAQQMAASRMAEVAAVRVARPSAAPPAAASHSNWFAWLLIVCIVGSGLVTWRLSKRYPPASDAPPPSGTAPLRRDLADAAPVAPAAASVVLGQWVTQLSVPLSGGDSNPALRELLIPELSLRVNADLAPTIEARRGPLLRRMMERLGSLSYSEMLQPDAEAVVRRQIESAVCDVLNQECYPALPLAGDPGGLPPPPPVRALLPQRFSLR